MLSVLLSVISLVSLATSCELFTSLDQVYYVKQDPNDLPKPYKPHWFAALSWAIKGTEIFPNNHFYLTLPCVYKFNTDKDYVPLIGTDNVEYGQCFYNPGELSVSYSKLDCVISNNVVKTTNVKGQIHIPLTFNAGGSHHTLDKDCAEKYDAGSNVIAFSGGKAFKYTVNFAPGLPYNPDNGVFHIRYHPKANRLQPYLVAGNCPKGYSKGYMGFEMKTTTARLDCGHWEAKRAESKKFNSWMFAESDQHLSKSVTCSNNILSVYYKDVDKGDLPYLDAIIVPTDGFPVKMVYYNRYTCKGESIEHIHDGYYEWDKDSEYPTAVTTAHTTATAIAQ
ncbi:uncharacterized protein SPAPADRAFT_50349 [Spathaspora passalidarum NRRL Y-27907]|uniref:Agglutinin-like protein N-terminal domain-containing protein n=2 Tax=Spathaspora passalidarum TaxID=340170 RepID=G3AMM9_SPAPN|nr:uncharacterized protein SPAPADRAFT_50349 [Spathaspora passalidarum NRRL Y-27907]EGW33473.1 hypothetical protein SPAPADRAFT_50349 [Spathaspora passalidarum NRRL Y-27907]QQV74272.1 agglutinin-like protein [Spathaspora passalidarum]